VVQAEKNGDAWTLVGAKELPADSAEVGALLDSLQNLESEEVVNDNATDLSPFGLSEPKVAVSVVAAGAAKPYEFELGDAVPAGSGIFGRVPGQKRLFTVSSTLENALNKSLFDLRNRNLVTLKRDAIKSIEVTTKPKEGYRLVHGAKGEDEW